MEHNTYSSNVIMVYWQKKNFIDAPEWLTITNKTATLRNMILVLQQITDNVGKAVHQDSRKSQINQWRVCINTNDLFAITTIIGS